MVLGGLLGAVGAVTGLAAGAVGSHDAHKAAGQQREYIDRGLGSLYEAHGELVQGRANATPFLDELLAQSAGLEDDLLGQIDPVTAREVRRIRQEREFVQAQVQADQQRRGLDSFTTRSGAQASAAGQASNSLVELNARMSAQRGAAIQAGRSAHLTALGNRAQFEFGSQQARAGVRSQQASLLGNIQVQAPNTAAGIGQLGAGFLNLHRTSVIEKSLAAAAPGATG